MPDADDTDGLPAGLASPARRALMQAGYTSLDMLATVRESDLSCMHGMGAKAIEQITVALAARGRSLADEEKRSRAVEQALPADSPGVR